MKKCVEKKEKERIVAIHFRVSSQCLCSGLVVSHSISNQRGWGEEHSATLQSNVNKIAAEGQKGIKKVLFIITQVDIVKITSKEGNHIQGPL